MTLALWALVILAGAVGQFVDAAVGMGFGVLSSSFMIAGGVAPALVVTTVNVAKIGNGLMSAASHASVGNVRWRWVLPLALPGVVGAVGGALLLVRVLGGFARSAVPVLLLIMGLALLIRFWRMKSIRTDDQAQAEPEAEARWLPLAIIGFLGGGINAMTGGYGPFTTSSLLLLRGGHPRFAVGTVNAVEVIVASAAAVTLLLQLDLATFTWQLPVALMVGGLFTSLPAAYVSKRLSARTLGVTVGLTLVLINVWAISKTLA
jgi:uncharacterized membrane protein YfcA